MKRELDFDKVVLLGRTFKEYITYFKLSPSQMKGKHFLDIAGGVSSFCAEANLKGVDAKSYDPIFEYSSEDIEKQCKSDLENVITQLPSVSHIYKWGFYKNIKDLKQYREKAYQKFLIDYSKNRSNYISGSLPHTPFTNNEFDISLVSYFLFLYSDRFDLDFHVESILELSRISRQEVRVYPLTNLKGEKPEMMDYCLKDIRLKKLEIEIKKLDMEFFFKNSNEVMVIKTSADNP